MFVVLPSLLLYDTEQVTNLKLLGHLANERWEKIGEIRRIQYVKDVKRILIKKSKGCEENSL